MFDNRVTRNQYGQNNLRESQIFSDMPLQDELITHQYVNDFDQFVAADWTITKVGTGTTALGAINGGALVLTNTAGGSDSISMKLANASFQLVAGQRNWGRFIAQVNNTDANIILGLASSTTTPFSGFTDGIWLSNSGTALTLSIQANSGSAQTLTLTPTLVAGSFFTFSWYYDGGCYPGPANGRVVIHISGAGVSSAFAGEIACGSTFPFTTLLTPQMAIQNTTTNARVLTVDLMAVYQERASILATPTF